MQSQKSLHVRDGAILYPANIAKMSLSEDQKRYLIIYTRKFEKQSAAESIEKMNDDELLEKWNIMCNKHSQLNETCATNCMKIKYLALDGLHKFGHLIKAPVYRHVPFDANSRDVGINDFGFVQLADKSLVTVKDNGGYGMYQQCTYEECEKYPCIEDQSGSLFNWPYPNHSPSYCPEVAVNYCLNADYHPEKSKQPARDNISDILQKICDSEICKNINEKQFAEVYKDLFDTIKDNICNGETDYDKIHPDDDPTKKKRNVVFIKNILLFAKWMNTYK